MSHSSLINLGLQIGFAALRYTMMGWVYARSNLDAVGHINALLTYVTAITFVAGFELHHVVNRSLLMGKGRCLRWGLDRVALAAFVIGFMAWMADSILFKASRHMEFMLLVLLVSAAEYMALELGRLLIIKTRYLVVTICGFIRSVSPFLVVVIMKEPTLESMLYSWLLGTMLVLAVQAWLLWRGNYFSVEGRCIDRADYRSAALFFAAGVSMALMPTIERWLVTSFYSGAVLGQYALGMTLVSICDLVLQGGIWQPFITRILQRLAHTRQGRSTAGWLLVVISAVYILAFVMAVLFSSHLLALINKAPLPVTILFGVFSLGLSKAFYSLLFYCLYAKGQERRLVMVQVMMVITLLLAVCLGVWADFDAGSTFSMAGVFWICLILSHIYRWFYCADNNESALASKT